MKAITNKTIDAVRDVCGLNIAGDVNKAAAVDYPAMAPAELKKAIDRAMCKDHGGKMAGMMSLSTSPLINANCIKRMKSGATICAHCFSARMQGRYNTLRAKLIRNTFFAHKRRNTGGGCPNDQRVDLPFRGVRGSCEHHAGAQLFHNCRREPAHSVRALD